MKGIDSLNAFRYAISWWSSSFFLHLKTLVNDKSCTWKSLESFLLGKGLHTTCHASTPQALVCSHAIEHKRVYFCCRAHKTHQLNADDDFGDTSAHCSLGLIDNTYNPTQRLIFWISCLRLARRGRIPRPGLSLPFLFICNHERASKYRFECRKDKRWTVHATRMMCMWCVRDDSTDAIMKKC